MSADNGQIPPDGAPAVQFAETAFTRITAVCGQDPTAPTSASIAASAAASTAPAEREAEITANEQPFPTEALPPILQAFVTEASQELLLPESLIAPVVLAAVSTSIGNGLVVQTWGDQYMRGNLYVLNVAPSGVGKSSTFKRVMQPIVDAERNMVADWKKNVQPRLKAERDISNRQREALQKKKIEDGQKEAAISELAKIEERLQEVEEQDVEPKLFCQDVTREKLADLLASQPGESLASLSPDARGIISVLKGRYQKGASDEDIYLSCYSGDGYKQDRLNRPGVYLVSPCLVVGWMVQNDVWKSFVEDETFVQSGLLPRFLVSAPEVILQPLPPTPFTMAQATRSAYNDLIDGLLREYRNVQGHPGIVTVDPATRNAMRDFENDLRLRRNPGGDLHDVESFASRWTENAWRIALVLHAAYLGFEATSYPLDLGTARAALAIQNWFINEQLRMLRHHREGLANLRLQRLVQVMQRHYPTNSATIRDLVNSNGFKPAELERLAQEHKNFVSIVEVQNPQGGRPSRWLTLRPVLS